MASAYTNGLSPDQIDDLVETTLHKFEKDKWVDISLELQRYFAYENMLLKDRVGVDGGDLLQWQIKVRNGGSAINSGMYAVDDVQVVDLIKHAQIGWTKQTCNFAYDIDEAEFNNPSTVRILNMLSARRHGALTSFAELMEENFWGTPANSTDAAEQKKPNGVPYFIVRNATEGFNGSVPIGGGHSTVAGVSPSTYTNWKNYTAQYGTMSKADLVRKLRKAITQCRFKPPVPHKSPTAPDSPRYVLCTTYDVIQKMEELLEDQNQNLGNDIASKDGDVVFRKVPMTWVPYLDANHDSTGAVTTNHFGRNPIYGINKDSFRMVFKRGRFMRRTKPMIAPNQHSVRHVHWDSWCNFQCLDRRSNFVITQSA